MTSTELSFNALRRAASIVVACCVAITAHAVDTYNGTTLTLPSLVIGNATYTNVQVPLASILGGPAGSSPAGAVDSYNPLTGQLTVQSVNVGAQTYHNVVATVGAPVTIGSVTGADVYSGGSLTAPYVQLMSSAGQPIYPDVTVNIAASPVKSMTVAGGMPTVPWDQFNATTGQLLIPAVQVGGAVYTNVTVTFSGTPHLTHVGGTGTAQTIQFTAPNLGLGYIRLGQNSAISATATSGLPVSFFVNTPSLCTITATTAQEQYVSIGYIANTGETGYAVVGGVSEATNVFQVNTVTGWATVHGSSALQPLTMIPTYLPYTSTTAPPYPLFQWANNYVFDDILYINGSPLFDAPGIALQVPGDIINLGYYQGSYYYLDTYDFSAGGTNLTYIAAYEAPYPATATGNALTALSDGICSVTAFQGGNGTFAPATPVTATFDVGVVTLP